MARNIRKRRNIAATSNAPTLLTIRGRRKSTVVKSTISISERRKADHCWPYSRWRKLQPFFFKKHRQKRCRKLSKYIDILTHNVPTRREKMWTEGIEFKYQLHYVYCQKDIVHGWEIPAYGNRKKKVYDIKKNYTKLKIGLITNIQWNCKIQRKTDIKYKV